MSKLLYRTLRENVADEIRVKILNRELLPGARIIEQDLSKELGVSRGPIREALRQLEQEGIVEYTRNIGCSVKKITIEDLYEIYLLRSTYEILAVKMCGGIFTGDDISKLEKVMELMKDLDSDYNTILSYDHMFHKVIVEKSDSERLVKVWNDLDYGSIVNCYVGSFNEKAAADRQYVIHKELVDVCRTNDMEKICKAISNHYMHSVARFMKEEGLPEKKFRFTGDLFPEN